MFALKDNLNKMVHAIIILNVNKGLLGMENNANLFHATLEIPTITHVDVVKPLFMSVLQVHIGTDIDAFLLPTFVQLV